MPPLANGPTPTPPSVLKYAIKFRRSPSLPANAGMYEPFSAVTDTKLVPGTNLIFPSKVCSCTSCGPRLRANPRTDEPSFIFTVTTPHGSSGQNAQLGHAAPFRFPFREFGSRSVSSNSRTVRSFPTPDRSGPFVAPLPNAMWHVKHFASNTARPAAWSPAGCAANADAFQL